MKRIIFSALFALANYISISQQLLRIERNQSNSTFNYYLLSIPKGEIKGILSLDFQMLSDSSQTYAYQNGIVLMYCYPTNNYGDLMLENKPLKLWDEMNNEVMEKYKIPKNKIIVGGMSLGGTAAVRYVQFNLNNDPKNKVAGIIAVDPPLDFERFWKECDKKVSINFNELAASEGKWVNKILENKLGGTPKTKLKFYRKTSPYNYNSINGGNAFLLKNTKLRIYHEPDVAWWMENRRQDYMGMNSVDAAGLINQLQILGNKHAFLIETKNKGYKPDGSRHPHSWSIVDEIELLDWCLTIFKN